ncbi:unnamed protein product [Caenorhabditis bovis]|uniref:N-acetylgalactosaminide beta-1,3-galactosyltransferase n=1 Tax=Caenorhabditis bovis TaxID=2654633 RepID=A0A8S1E5K8_9PELO|nr:unnamed protein product [Caenorhabditis bovis]
MQFSSTSRKFDQLAIFILFLLLIIILYLNSLNICRTITLIPTELYSQDPNDFIVGFEAFKYFPRTHVQKLSEGIVHSSGTQNLPNNGSLFCFVETAINNYNHRVPAIWATWLPRCPNGRFFTPTELRNKSIPYSTVFRNFDDSYEDLFRKTLFAFYYTYTQISSDFDWYLKADDNTYVIVERLQKFLMKFDRDEPHFLGFRMKPFLKHGYNAGGAGYVLSNRAVKMFVEKLYNDTTNCPFDCAEDRGISRCLASIGIYPGDTRDDNGMERFNTFMPFKLDENDEAMDYFYYNHTSNFWLSNDWISLHQLSPDSIRLVDEMIRRNMTDQ